MRDKSFQSLTNFVYDMRYFGGIGLEYVFESGNCQILVQVFFPFYIFYFEYKKVNYSLDFGTGLLDCFDQSVKLYYIDRID